MGVVIIVQGVEFGKEIMQWKGLNIQKIFYNQDNLDTKKFMETKKANELLAEFAQQMDDKGVKKGSLLWLWCNIELATTIYPDGKIAPYKQWLLMSEDKRYTTWIREKIVFYIYKLWNKKQRGKN